MAFKPTLCLDFDGVIHSYKSPWKNARHIPDPPVPGALGFIIQALSYFEVAVFSSRSHQWGGRRAMRHWLHKHYVELGTDTVVSEEAQVIRDVIAQSPYATTDYSWKENVEEWSWQLVRNHLSWPRVKPPAFLMLDDRALTFAGEWPDVRSLKEFKPWNK